MSPRERSLVTISSLIAMGKTAQLAGHLARGLEERVAAHETSGLLAHLAIYSGWPNAVSALAVYEQVYTTPTRNKIWARSDVVHPPLAGRRRYSSPLVRAAQVAASEHPSSRN